MTDAEVFAFYHISWISCRLNDLRSTLRNEFDEAIREINLREDVMVAELNELIAKSKIIK